MTQLAQRLGLDLANALPGYLEGAPDLFQRVLRAFADAEPHSQDELFARRQRLEDAAGLIRQGYRVCALKGGISDWLAANFPTDTKDAPKQKPPTAGALKG